MPKFRVSVSKNQKKYTLILSANSEVKVKNKVHLEWYSILSIEEIDELKIEWHKFIFEALDKNKNVKKGKVVSSDDFNVYVKLREGLSYDVKFLYSEEDKDKSEWEKLDIITHLEDQYSLYSAHKNKNSPKKESTREKKESNKSLETFYMKKELEETYRLIDFVLIKLKNILENAIDEDIDFEKKDKLKTLFNSIVKIKKTTNINKLKEVWELALKKIWEIELKILEKNKDWKSKKLLKETNTLLKKLGSKEHFIEKEKDINYIIEQFTILIKDKFNSFIKKRKKNKEEEPLDKDSAGYWKTELLIKKYLIKQKENNLEIIKTFFKAFKKEEVVKLNDLKLKSKVIKQNIILLKMKQRGKKFSYTTIIKWYNFFVELLLLLLKVFNTYILWFIYIFSITVSIFFLLNRFNIYMYDKISLDIGWVFILLYVFLASIFIFISRGVITVSINFAIFFFMIILWVVNF